MKIRDFGSRMYDDTFERYCSYSEENFKGKKLDFSRLTVSNCSDIKSAAGHGLNYAFYITVDGKEWDMPLGETWFSYTSIFDKEKCTDLYNFAKWVRKHYLGEPVDSRLFSEYMTKIRRKYMPRTREGAEHYAERMEKMIMKVTNEINAETFAEYDKICEECRQLDESIIERRNEIKTRTGYHFGGSNKESKPAPDDKISIPEHFVYEAGYEICEISGECMCEERPINNMLQKIDKYLENERKFDIKLYDMRGSRKNLLLQLTVTRIKENTVLNYDSITNYIMSLKQAY